MAKKTIGKRSSKTSEAPARPKTRVPADQRLWAGSDYVAVPIGSGE